MARLSSALPRSFDGWTRLLLVVVSWIFLATMIGEVVAPIFQEVETLGGHDWDHMAMHRYLMVKTVRVFHELPFWNPYGCGGHTEWGAFDGGTVLVSPWTLLYLVVKLPLALRLEVLGTAVLSAVGTWLLARRFTKSPGLCAFACAIFVVNGRWSLQTTSGHTWHLYYFFLPWTLYFYERARRVRPLLWDWDEEPVLSLAARRRNIAYVGICIAMMVYTGAIYPLPHTLFILGVYAVLLAVITHSAAPMLIALQGAVIGLALSAPKLLPVIATLSKYPRLVDSPETMDVAAFITLLTNPNQDFNSRIANVSHWGWHEWGMYIGWGPVLAIGLAALLSRRADVPLKWVGLLLVVLGFGSFFPYAPWPLLHELPIFKSQHVPSRWLYPAAMVLGLLVASRGEAALGQIGKFRRIAEVVLVLAAGYIALDIARVAKVPMNHAFWMTMSPALVPMAQFHQETKAPPELRYVIEDYAPPALPAAMANVGVIESVSFAGLGPWAPRDANGKIPGLGAKGRGDQEYRGEVFTASGVGSASFLEWSPTRVRVVVDGARPGDLVVMNQNFDPGWSANGKTAIEYKETLAARISAPHEEFVFRYVPPYLSSGLVLLVLGVAATAVWIRRANVASLLTKR